MDYILTIYLHKGSKWVLFLLLFCVCVKGEAEEFAQLVKWSP